MTKALTDAACRKFRPGPERRRIRDAGARSLFLVIEPSGHKAWQMRFRRPDGRPAKVTLGPFDQSGRELKGDPQIGQPLSLQAARQLAAQVHRERALGHDVAADHRARRHRQRSEVEDRAANTFAASVSAYIDEHAKPETRNWQGTALLLGLRYVDGEPTETKDGLAQRWGDKPVREIDAHLIWGVIDEARRIGIPGIKARNRKKSEARARALFVALSSFFSWLKRQRRVEGNPCLNLSRPAGAVARDRVLSNDEVRWFWQACDSVDAPRVPGAARPFAPLLRLLLVTGARLNEVAGMTRAELSEDGATWSLPGSRTKNTRPHIVPLSPMARDLIASVKGKGEGSSFIFTTTGRSRVSGWSRTKKRLDAAMLAIAKKERGKDAVIAPWRLHDLRRTAVTGMVELGIAPHLVELIVNHVSGARAGVAGVYNRSEMLAERKAALERWAAHVQGLVAPRDNVVSLLSGKRGRRSK
jgi:integrase